MPNFKLCIWMGKFYYLWLYMDYNKLWKILRDGNTRPPYLSPENTVCRYFYTPIWIGIDRCTSLQIRCSNVISASAPGVVLLAGPWQDFPVFLSWKELFLLFSCSVVSESLWPHGLQHARLPRPSLSPGACSNSCPLSWRCHPTTWSSVSPFCPRFSLSQHQDLPPLSQSPVLQGMTPTLGAAWVFFPPLCPMISRGTTVV